jgi:hypothetical protein
MSLRSNPDAVNLSTKASSSSRLSAAPMTSRTTTTSLSEGGSCLSRVTGADGSQISRAGERLRPQDTGRKTDRRQGAGRPFGADVSRRRSKQRKRAPHPSGTTASGTSMSSHYRTPARFSAVAAFWGLLWQRSAEEQPTRARRTSRRFWRERYRPHRRRPPCFRS